MLIAPDRTAGRVCKEVDTENVEEGKNFRIILAVARSMQGRSLFKTVIYFKSIGL